MRRLISGVVFAAMVAVGSPSMAGPVPAVGLVPTGTLDLCGRDPGSGVLSFTYRGRIHHDSAIYVAKNGSSATGSWQCGDPGPLTSQELALTLTSVTSSGTFVDQCVGLLESKTFGFRFRYRGVCGASSGQFALTVMLVSSSGDEPDPHQGTVHTVHGVYRSVA